MTKAKKVRVTKAAIKKIRDAKKITSHSSKKKIIPGPWTDKKTKLKIKAEFRKSDDFMSEIIGSVYGSYLREELFGQKGWYEIICNVKADPAIIEKHGMDDFLAACEVSLSNQKDAKGKLKFGTVVILEMCLDNSQDRGFISIKAKTNKKSIAGFRAIRGGEIQVLGEK